MTTVNLGRLALDGLRTGGLARACRWEVRRCMARLPHRDGTWQHFRCVQFRSFAPRDLFAGPSARWLPLRSSCNGRSLNSVSRQATRSAVVTLIGNVFAHPSHFGPQWAEPLATAAVSAGIAVAWWHIKTGWMRDVSQIRLRQTSTSENALAHRRWLLHRAAENYVTLAAGAIPLPLSGMQGEWRPRDRLQ